MVHLIDREPLLGPILNAITGAAGHKLLVHAGISTSGCAVNIPMTVRTQLGTLTRLLMQRHYVSAR